MLKPADPAPGDGDRPVGEIVSDLVEEGKAYARAEISLAKAMATAKAKALRTPALLLAAAALIGMAALNALAVAIFILLAMVIPPLLAAVLTLALISGTAAILGWIGLDRLRKL